MEIEIDLLKFEEISKRHDIKKPKWFALDNDLFSHPDFFKLSADEFKAWIWILCVASKVNKSKVRLDTEVFAHQCRCKENVFYATIEKLNGKRLAVQIRTEPYKSVPTLHYITNITEQNKHNSIDQSCALTASDFEFLYKKYPRKEGKSKGLTRIKVKVKTPEDLKRLETAIDNYSAHCKRNVSSPKFIKKFDSFVSEWEDWVDPANGSSEKPVNEEHEKELERIFERSGRDITRV